MYMKFHLIIHLYTSKSSSLFLISDTILRTIVSEINKENASSCGDCGRWFLDSSKTTVRTNM